MKDFISKNSMKDDPKSSLPSGHRFNHPQGRVSSSDHPMRDDPKSSLPSGHRFDHPQSRVSSSNHPMRDDPKSSLPSRHRFDHQAERVVSQRLSALRRGDSGYILDVRDTRVTFGSEVERRLLEMGFVEGAYIEMLQKGLFGQNPLAVRINQSVTVALRRREAEAVLVRLIVAEKK